MTSVIADFHFSIDDIEEDSSKGFTLENGQTLFAVKKDGAIYVYRNRCPHLGIELEWQEDRFLDADNALIQCSTHGALFIIESGECVAGPCLGENLEVLPHYIESGTVYVQTSQLSE